MVSKKYQVFISSTFRDLVDERQDTIRNILDLNHIPAGMELFPATDVEQLSYIKKVIDECDYYLLIVGGRYGSMDSEGVSFTEREYDYAVETGKFVIAFVHAEPDAISVKNSDVKPEAIEALTAFREKVKAGRLVREWKDRAQLENAVLKSLTIAFSTYPQVGWIRGDTAASQQLLEQSNKALQENAKLRQEIAALKSETPKKYENLADLNDTITIRYRSRWKSSRNQYDYTYTDRTITLTWHQIFLHLASLLTTSKTEGVIPTAVKEAMVEAKAEYTAYDINDMDAAKIKTQYLALGLIKAKIGQSTNDSIREFLSLTDHGRHVYMDAMVVRKT